MKIDQDYMIPRSYNNFCYWKNKEGKVLVRIKWYPLCNASWVSGTAPFGTDFARNRI